MAHFGILSLKGHGHLNPLVALSKELTARKHRITFFLPSHLEETIRKQNLGFYAIDYALASKSPRKQAQTRIGHLRLSLRRIEEELAAYLNAYPPAIRAKNVDALIIG